MIHQREDYKEGLRVIWKVSRAYTQYPKEINSEVIEFNISGRVARQRVAEAEGGGRSQLSGSKSQEDEGKGELINSKTPSTQNHVVQGETAQSSHSE